MMQTKNKTTLIVIILSFLPIILPAQESDTTLTYNLLLAPSSPAFNLIGIEPASVERPGNTTDFATTILNRTDNLNALPNDFSMEFAPYWVFGGGSDLTYEEFATEDRPFANILQTMSISFATATLSDPNLDGQAMGIGFRFSILQGTVDTSHQAYQKEATQLKKKMRNTKNQVGDEWIQRTKNDADLNVLKNQRVSLARQKEALENKKEEETDPTQKNQIQEQIELIVQQVAEVELYIAERQQEIMDELINQFQDQIQQLEEISTDELLKRTGWKVDAAGGLAWNFPNNDFDSGDLNKSGIWLNGGYEGRKVSMLGVIRYLHDDKLDDSSFDIGFRMILDSPKLKNFSISGEGVYRTFNSNAFIEDTYRIALVSDYSIAKNKNLSFTFGRDFEGNTSGNLLAMINLILGFGSERPF